MVRSTDPISPGALASGLSWLSLSLGPADPLCLSGSIREMGKWGQTSPPEHECVPSFNSCVLSPNSVLALGWCSGEPDRPRLP